MSWSKSDGLCPLLATKPPIYQTNLWHILRDWRLLLPDVLPPFLLSPPALALLFRSGPQFTMCPGWMLRHSCFWRHLPSWKESVWLNLYTLSLDSPQLLKCTQSQSCYNCRQATMANFLCCVRNSRRSGSTAFCWRYCSCTGSTVMIATVLP